MHITESSYNVFTTTGGAKAGPTTVPGARVKYMGGTVSLTAGSSATVRIHRDGASTGQVIDSFTVNFTSFSTGQHFFDPGVDAGTGIYVEVVALTGSSPAVDVVTYWQ